MARRIPKLRPEWGSCELGTNPLENLTEKQFIKSLAAFQSLRMQEMNFATFGNWALRYLNEAERRWKPQP